MILEHTFERGKEGRIHMKNISTFEKNCGNSKTNERTTTESYSFFRSESHVIPLIKE